MATVHVRTETETGRGWSFDVLVVDDSGAETVYEVALSWADYDLWCGGARAPVRVIESLFEFLLEREPAEAIRRRFDASLVRRFFSEVDDVMRRAVDDEV